MHILIPLENIMKNEDVATMVNEQADKILQICRDDPMLKRKHTNVFRSLFLFSWSNHRKEKRMREYMHRCQVLTYCDQTNL